MSQNRGSTKKGVFQDVCFSFVIENFQLIGCEL
jgi:hypothetical protein